ncbi:hypothetical protein IFM89_017538 [Coptis chinensis]|uniref:Uncharacterized protein n=1 Tax=Coptis chinensis TaxID=261450 RepID=A0A835HUE3_9MAGN|nr:hypothetical protein IFM89_017538 [Coptis chinensis]
MQLNFNPATVKMLSNLNVLVIAVLLKMVMKRKFSIIQWGVARTMEVLRMPPLITSSTFPGISSCPITG